MIQPFDIANENSIVNRLEAKLEAILMTPPNDGFIKNADAIAELYIVQLRIAMVRERLMLIDITTVLDDILDVPIRTLLIQSNELVPLFSEYDRLEALHEKISQNIRDIKVKLYGTA